MVSAYMDDVTWLEVMKKLAPNVRNIPIIRDHPDWWSSMSYDVFKLHVNINDALDFLISLRFTLQRRRLVHHTLTGPMIKHKQRKINEYPDSC